MANILIIGFDKLHAYKLRDKIDTIIKDIPKTHDATTSVVSNVTTQWCHSYESAPYLIVRHTSLLQAKKIATVLHQKLNLDIEIEKIDGFFERNPAHE